MAPKSYKINGSGGVSNQLSSASGGVANDNGGAAASNAAKRNGGWRNMCVTASAISRQHRIALLGGAYRAG